MAEFIYFETTREVCCNGVVVARCTFDTTSQYTVFVTDPRISRVLPASGKTPKDAMNGFAHNMREDADASRLFELG